MTLYYDDARPKGRPLRSFLALAAQYAWFLIKWAFRIAVFVVAVWAIVLTLSWALVKSLPRCDVYRENKSFPCRVAWTGYATTLTPYFAVTYLLNGMTVYGDAKPLPEQDAPADGAPPSP